MSALYFYQKWVKDCKRVRDNGYPDLGKNSLISITKVFLERIDALISLLSNFSFYFFSFASFYLFSISMCLFPAFIRMPSLAP